MVELGKLPSVEQHDHTDQMPGAVPGHSLPNLGKTSISVNDLGQRLLDGDFEGVALTTATLDGHPDRARGVRNVCHQGRAIDVEADIVVSEDHLLRSFQAVTLNDH